MDQKRTKEPAGRTDPAGGGATRDDRPGGGSEVGSGAPRLTDDPAPDLPIVDPDTREGLGAESLTAHPDARDPDAPSQQVLEVDNGPSS